MAKRGNIKITTKFDGVEDLLKGLEGLSKDVATDVVAGMVQEGGNVVAKNIRRMAPVKDGNLRKSIKVKVIKKPSRGTAAAIVGPDTGWYAKGRKLKSKKHGSKPARPAWYAHNVEFGHATRDGGKHVAAKPFMRPGTAASKGEAAIRMTLGFQKGLTRAVKKIRVRNFKGNAR